MRSTVGTLALLAVLGAIISSAAATSAWDGEWSDTWGLGGRMFLCGDDSDSQLYGVWSNAGIIVGKLSNGGNTAKGSWYEAGLGPCSSGSFEWNLSGNSLSGTYNCKGSSDKQSVVETRSTSLIPSNVQCGRLSTKDSKHIGGHWELKQSGRQPLDICRNSDDSFEGSFEDSGLDYAGNAFGFIKGDCSESGRVARGYSAQANGDQHIVLVYRTADEELVTLSHPATTPFEHAPQVTAASVGGQVNVFRRRGRPYDCSRNEFVFDAIFGDAVRTTSVSMMMSAMIIVVAVVLFV